MYPTLEPVLKYVIIKSKKGSFTEGSRFFAIKCYEAVLYKSMN